MEGHCLDGHGVAGCEVAWSEIQKCHGVVTWNGIAWSGTLKGMAEQQAT